MSIRLALKSHPAEPTCPIAIGPDKAQTCGDKTLWIVAGPCAVESMPQLEAVTCTLKNQGVRNIRGGVFKPRTSPYAFQGMAEDGLDLFREIRSTHDMTVVSEVMSASQIEMMLPAVDVLQVGSRNMQNFDLLKALGEVDKPILLKRGLSATIDEMLWAAEYILAGGNSQVILCERGIRSFDTQTRNVLDLGGVAVLKQLTHLPVIVDPSHAAGRRDIIIDLAKAAVAVGADGLIVEIHPEPDQSVSDASQALSLPDFDNLIAAIAPVAQAVGREMPQATRVLAHA